MSENRETIDPVKPYPAEPIHFLSNTRMAIPLPGYVDLLGIRYDFAEETAMIGARMGDDYTWMHHRSDAYILLEYYASSLIPQEKESLQALCAIIDVISRYTREGKDAPERVWQAWSIPATRLRLLYGEPSAKEELRQLLATGTIGKYHLTEEEAKRLLQQQPLEEIITVIIDWDMDSGRFYSEILDWYEDSL